MADEIKWPYYPQPGSQTEMWESLHPDASWKYVGFGGPRGGGKSYGMRSWFATLCSQMPVHCVIVRQELEDLKRNHIEPMKTELKDFIDRNIIKYHTQNKEFTFPNGSKLGFMYCKTDADLNRFQGLGIDLLGLEEAGQFTKPQMAYMISSVRTSPIAAEADTTYSPRVLFTFNWGGPGHKYLRRIFWDGQPQPHVDKPADYSYYKENENPEDYKFIFAPFEENKKLQEADPQYQEKLRLLSDKLQQAYIDGDPDAFTGTFFNVAKYVHEIEPFEIPETWNLFGGLDPGTASHCSFGLYAKSPDGQIVKIFNYYQEKTTPVEHARNIKELLTYDERVVQWTGGRMPSYVVAGKDAFAKQNRFSIHAHEYTWADIFMQEAGIPLIPCNNARVPGATAVLQVLDFEYDYDAPEGATDAERIKEYPTLRFFKGQCEDTINELIALEHDEKNPDDVAQGLGVEDHAYDETRYAVMSAVRPMEHNFDESRGDLTDADYGRHRTDEDLFANAVPWGSEDEDSWENIY